MEKKKEESINRGINRGNLKESQPNLKNIKRCK